MTKAEMGQLDGVNMATEMGTTTMTEAPIFDPKEVDQSVKEAMDLRGYPRYQVSKFFGKDYQVVVRTETFAELMDAMKNVKVLVDASIVKEQHEPTPKNDVYERQAQGDNGTCRQCGAKRIFNPKTGKMFCEKKCWLQGK